MSSNINDIPLEQLRSVYRICYQLTEYYQKIIYVVRLDTRTKKIVILYGPPEDDPVCITIAQNGIANYE
jgi:hypothetical protein